MSQPLDDLSHPGDTNFLSMDTDTDSRSDSPIVTWGRSDSPVVPWGRPDSPVLGHSLLPAGGQLTSKPEQIGNDKSTETTEEPPTKRHRSRPKRRPAKTAVENTANVSQTGDGRRTPPNAPHHITPEEDVASAQHPGATPRRPNADMMPNVHQATKTAKHRAARRAARATLMALLPDRTSQRAALLGEQQTRDDSGLEHVNKTTDDSGLEYVNKTTTPVHIQTTEQRAALLDEQQTRDDSGVNYGDKTTKQRIEKLTALLAERRTRDDKDLHHVVGEPITWLGIQTTEQRTAELTAKRTALLGEQQTRDDSGVNYGDKTTKQRIEKLTAERTAFRREQRGQESSSIERR